MKLSAKQLLARLGSGTKIADVCAEACISREEFNAWWDKETKARVSATSGSKKATVKGTVRIERDANGIPHIFADNDIDLFFGFGYATAQDRLFQLDYLRRRAVGRLSEILGPEGLELDLIARTVGLHRIAETEWKTLPDETRRLTQAFSDGINSHLEECRGNLPIEFDLLDYQPEAWSPVDCLAIEGEFRWYLTGRFPVIVIPELAKRTLGEGPLYEALLQAEVDAEAILPEGSYPKSRVGSQPVGVTVGDAQEGTGSNNWVVSGAKSVTGKPLVASDPHIAFAAVSCWHEVHLHGGSFNVTGMTYIGMPAVMFGRNERVAWGCTNNICSQRDLYQEKTDAAHPGCFLYDGKWEPAKETVETIQVRGREPVQRTIRASRNGPIVDEILPPAAKGTGPVSLRWLGMYPCGWLTALLQMDRAKSAAEFRTAAQPWHVPTFCVVYADVDGHIGYQAVGRIPIRNVWERGYRPGWDPQHQWAGLIPYEGMPAAVDPQRGWMATANNRVATNDYPYPLAGTWTNNYRAVRIRQMIESREKFSRDDFVRMHQDTMSLRAVDCVPKLLAVLSNSSDRCIQEAATHLAAWDGRVEPDRVAASIFNVFFQLWCQTVANQRFSGESAALISGSITGLANRLLGGDDIGWFTCGKCSDAIVANFNAALDQLTKQFGPDMLGWSWGRLHPLHQKHILTTRGELSQLLDRGGMPVRGDMTTVCNTGADANHAGTTGAGYRLIADLADDKLGLWAIDAGSESGHPGSPHYNDQITDWLNAQYHHLPLTGSSSPGETLILEPR